MKKSRSILKDKSFEFALSVIHLYRQIIKDREFVMSKQLLRSGTSVGANIREAQNAQSRLDFIHKLSISQKECDESMYWLELLNKSGYLKDEVFMEYHSKAESLLKMLRSAILSTKQRPRQNP